MVQPEQRVVYAIHEYEIPGSGFLPLKAGDIIHVDEDNASGWWLGTNLRGQQGVFPCTYTLPYVFPPPAEDLVRDIQVILLAHEFGVDVASGVPLSLHKCHNADLVEARGTPPPLSLLLKQVGECLLDRETERSQVMELLSHLLQLRTCGREEQAQIMRSISARRKKEDACQAALGEARAALQVFFRDITAQKCALLRTGVVPTFGWYERFNHLAVTVASLSKSLSSEEAWRSTLRELKEMVGCQEEDLICLSSNCAKEEDVFARTASSLQARVEWRDRCVARMLAHWEKQAEAATTTYMIAKKNRHTTEERLQSEAAHLLCRLREGRERFIETKGLYRQLRRQSEDIVMSLQRKEALDSVSQQIVEADRAIAAHQQKQLHRLVTLS